MDYSVAVIILIVLIAGFFMVYNPCESSLSSLSDPGPPSYYDYDSGVPGPFVCFLAGVHGNEYAGPYTLESMIQAGFPKIKKGRVRIIPRANPWGLQRGSRYQLNVLYPDINRNFTDEGGSDATSRALVELIKDADLVVDFHEGWGFHQISPESVGSTLSPTSIEPAPSLAQAATDRINSIIPPGKKQFQVLPDIYCDIPGTLSCYMQHQKKAYILVETTGQNNVQPLPTRVIQVQTVVYTIISSLLQ
jgi:hypothetical protein